MTHWPECDSYTCVACPRRFECPEYTEEDEFEENIDEDPVEELEHLMARVASLESSLGSAWAVIKRQQERADRIIAFIIKQEEDSSGE